MKAFSSEQIQELNKQSTSGRFIEAATFTRDMDYPAVKDYFVRNPRALTFNGHTYQPLDMAWIGLKMTSNMELPTNQIVISNLGGAVIDYIEENNVEIEDNDVLLQILFINKYNKITLVDEMLYQIEFVIADYYKACTINLGLSYGLNDIIPRDTLETQEYPGIRQDVIRVGSV